MQVIIDNVRSIMELSFRVWWVLSSFVSLTLCFFAILSIWDKWNERPVVVTFDDKTTSIGKIPFPAVTICTTEKFTQEHVSVEAFDETNGRNFEDFSSEK